MNALELRRQILTATSQRWEQMSTWTDPSVALPDRAHEMLSLFMAQYGYASEHLLGVLMEVDPARADEVARVVYDAWCDGGGIGEWLWEHAHELGMHDADGNLIKEVAS